MILEPFLRKIRRNREILGTCIGSDEHKGSAYADDLLFYLSAPQTSLPAPMLEVHRFGDLSNFKINFEKSALLPSHVPSVLARSLQHIYPFIWNRDSLVYLGVHISADQKLLYDLNYGSLLTGIIGGMKKWKGQYLTWFGRVSSIEMNILPRIIYILHMVPIKLPETLFRQIRKSFVAFVWNDRRPRLAYDILHRSKAEGGLGLPDITLYYKAMALVRTGATTLRINDGFD